MKVPVSRLLAKPPGDVFCCVIIVVDGLSGEVDWWYLVEMFVVFVLIGGDMTVWSLYRGDDMYYYLIDRKDWDVENIGYRVVYLLAVRANCYDWRVKFGVHDQNCTPLKPMVLQRTIKGSLGWFKYGTLNVSSNNHFKGSSSRTLWIALKGYSLRTFQETFGDPCEEPLSWQMVLPRETFFVKNLIWGCGSWEEPSYMSVQVNKQKRQKTII